MRGKLLAGGCSFTESNYLPNYMVPGYDYNHPKWPEILAANLDLDCINLGCSGASNDQISHSINTYIHKNYKNIKLVCIGWSDGARISPVYDREHTSQCLYHSYDTLIDKSHFTVDDQRFRDNSYQTTLQYVKMLNVLRKSRYNRFLDFKDIVSYRLSQAKQVEITCKHYNIPYMFLNMLQMFPPNLHYDYYVDKYETSLRDFELQLQFEIILNKYKIDTKKFIGWPLVVNWEEMTIPDPSQSYDSMNSNGFSIEIYFHFHRKDLQIAPGIDTHPNYTGHKFISNLFLQYIKYNYENIFR